MKNSTFQGARFSFLSPEKAHLEEKFSGENIFVNRARLCNLSSLASVALSRGKSAKQFVCGISTAYIKVQIFVFASLIIFFVCGIESNRRLIVLALNLHVFFKKIY